MKAIRILVSGIVQGVGFRFFAERAALQLGLTGWVRNLEDGRVEAVAAGPNGAIDEFIERLKTGPRAGRVERLETLATTLSDDADGFTIRH